MNIQIVALNVHLLKCSQLTLRNMIFVSNKQLCCARFIETEK